MGKDIDNELYRIQCNHIGQRFGGATLSSINLDGKRTQQLAKWLEERKGIFLFLGNTGIGKTYLCAAIIPWIHGKVKSYYYWNERKLFSKIRETMDQKGDYLKSLDYFIDHDFLMIDDIGSSGFNEWRKEVLFDLIDRRYESQRPTIFTSNLTREDFINGLGKRCISRLFASENFIVEMHKAEDLRLKGK